MSTQPLLATLRFQQIPTFALPVAIAFYFVLGLGPNYLIALLACVALVVGLLLLWQYGGLR